MPDLKKLCDEHDVSNAGKKEELVKRLVEVGAKPPAAPTPRSTPRRARSDVVDAEHEAPAENAAPANAAPPPKVVGGAKKPVIEKQSSAPVGHSSKMVKGGVVKRASAQATVREVNVK